jgi:hypothetical protein
MPGSNYFPSQGPLWDGCTLSNADLFWIRGIKYGRTYLNNIASPGREPEVTLVAGIAPRIDADPHLSARRLIQSMGIAASTACRYLTKVLGMKCHHLHWVEQTLAAAQKVARVELGQHMVQKLAK